MSSRMFFSCFLIVLSLHLATSTSCLADEMKVESMSLNDADRLARILLTDRTYDGQIIEADAKQLDPNFYGFQMIQGTQDAGNFEFTTIDVNKFTGTIWLVVGSNCSIYTSLRLDKELSLFRKKLMIGQKEYEKLAAEKPMMCE